MSPPTTCLLSPGHPRGFPARDTAAWLPILSCPDWRRQLWQSSAGWRAAWREPTGHSLSWRFCGGWPPLAIQKDMVGEEGPWQALGCILSDSATSPPCQAGVQGKCLSLHIRLPLCPAWHWTAALPGKAAAEQTDSAGQTLPSKSQVMVLHWAVSEDGEAG